MFSAMGKDYTSILHRWTVPADPDGEDTAELANGLEETAEGVQARGCWRGGAGETTRVPQFLMGILSKLLRSADRVHEAKEDLEYALLRDRRFDRAEALAREGTSNEAVVTGIRRRLNDGTETQVRLEWFTPEPRAGAVYFGDSMPLVVRLGSTVAIRFDGDAAVLDPAAMAGTPGAPADAGRRSKKVPDQGVEDQSLDMRVLSRLKKWTPETAVVRSFEQTQVFGMMTENWNIVVRRADGSEATVGRDHVPPYARWFVVPGAEVPIVVDPKDPSRAQIDWSLLAEQRATAGGRWQDPAPEGSIAAGQLSGAAVQEEAMSTRDGFDLSMSPESAEAIEGITVERCASIDAALTKRRIPPGEYDEVAARDYGVPVGRWSTIKEAWQARIRSDWRVGAAYGQAYSDATRRPDVG
jgi:hypothetical protein